MDGQNSKWLCIMPMLLTYLLRILKNKNHSLGFYLDLKKFPHPQTKQTGVFDLTIE